MDTDFTRFERKTLGCGVGEIPETLYAEASRLSGRSFGGTLEITNN